MNKVTTLQEVMNCFADGQSLMVGGFLAVGTPLALVDALVEKKVQNLKIICNDTAYTDKGVGKLFITKQIKKFSGSYIGTNLESVRQMHAGEIEVELIPQGTFVERIRSAGAGLGGILTPTGVGTVIEEGKKKLEVNGRTYLLETPLAADIALIKAAKADTAGNLIYRYAARNFNPLMATAAKLVIVEAEEIVEVGEIEPNEVMTPGIFVDMIVKGKGGY